ncbi:MAG: acyl-CoA thioesterase [Dehalococcoidia bacterium]
MGNGMPDGGGAITEFELTVRSTDMDADRNVNNAMYFQYFEQSRLEHLIRFGVVERPRPRDAGAPSFALAQTAAQFRAPAVHRDRLIVTTRTTAIGTTSFTLSYEVRRDDTLVCEGSSVQVWLDAEGKAAPLPPDVRAALERSLIQPAGKT